MENIKYTGGARIGTSNATWPFASLTVSKDRLDLNTTILGNYSFTRDDIISLEPHSGFVSDGVRINHKVPNYKEKVIFWTLGSAKTIINEIKNIGFLDYHTSTVDSDTKHQVIRKQKQGGFPIKKPFAIGVIVLWNVLFLFDFLKFFNGETDGIPLGNGAILALSSVLIISLLILLSKSFRRKVLKEDRELKDISKFLYFIIFITGFMLVNLFFIGKI